MSKIMVAKGDVHTIHHAGKVYARGKDGTFEVDDTHVDALRPHGLRLKSEIEAEAKTAATAKTNAELVAENEALKKRVAELEKKK